jgi:hypothetical protein
MLLLPNLIVAFLALYVSYRKVEKLGITLFPATVIVFVFQHILTSLNLDLVVVRVLWRLFHSKWQCNCLLIAELLPFFSFTSSDDLSPPCFA